MDRIIHLWRIVLFVAKAAVKVIIYSPQLFTAYLLSKTFLKKEEPAFTWIISILLMAFLIYCVVFLLKSALHILYEKGNWLWLPLLILLVTYTCVFPVWLSFGAIHQLMTFIAKEKAMPLTWLCSVAFGIYIYSRYRFLSAG